MKKIRDIMSTYVETVQADASVTEAAGRMRAFNVGALPVLEGNRVTGIITDRAIPLRVTAIGKCGRFVRGREVMTSEVVSCRPADTAAEAVRLMETHQVTRLLVMDSSSRLVGMVVLSDLARQGLETLAGRVMAGMVQLIPVVPAMPTPP